MGFPPCNEGLATLVALIYALWGDEAYGQGLVWDTAISGHPEAFCLALHTNSP